MSGALSFSDSNLNELRQQMLSFARLQLTDEQQAEDVVQEALAGALKNAAAFSRAASLKTWVFAILKNKIADALRSRYRQPPMTDIDDCKDCSLADDQLFNERGHWHKDDRPQRWDAPEQLVHDEHFWRVFDRCLDALPAEQARVFMMREFIELDSQEICAALELTISNLHVLLYRARLRLRECLEDHWFGAGENT